MDTKVFTVTAESPMNRISNHDWRVTLVDGRGCTVTRYFRDVPKKASFTRAELGSVSSPMTN